MGPGGPARRLRGGLCVTERAGHGVLCWWELGARAVIKGAYRGSLLDRTTLTPVYFSKLTLLLMRLAC